MIFLLGKYTSNTTGNNTESSINDNTKNLSTISNKNNETYKRHLTGNQGISATYQAMIKQFRDNIVSIDKDIIDELNILFMGIY